MTKQLGCFCVCAVAALCWASSAQAGFQYNYARGHAGFAAKYDSNTGTLDIVLNVPDDGGADRYGNLLTPGEYSSDEIYILAPDATKTTQPAGTEWEFIGAAVGADIWVMPQGRTEGVPYMGMTVGKLSGDDWTGNVSYSLAGMDGPGNFSIWTTDEFGTPTAYWQSSDGCNPAEDFLTAALGTGGHHVNWGFTEEGIYNVDVQFSGTLANGEPASITKTFTFAVGNSAQVPEPGMIVMLLTASIAALYFHKRRKKLNRTHS